MYILTSQIHVFTKKFCILLYVSASNATWRKLPPAQLSKEYLTAVGASDKYTGVTSLVKRDVYGPHVGLCIEFWKTVFGIVPNSEQSRNKFICI